MSADTDRAKDACAGCGRLERPFSMTPIRVIVANPRTRAIETHLRPTCRDCIRTRGLLLSDSGVRQMLEETTTKVMDLAAEAIVADLKHKGTA